MVRIRVAVVCLERRGFFKKLVEKDKRLVIDNRKPEAVIAFGGDGTLLYAEKLYPQVTKLFIYHSGPSNKISMKCYQEVMEDFVAKKYSLTGYTKIEGSVNGKKLIGLNDINIAYTPPSALRFDVYVSNKLVALGCIGDGIVVATPYGSTAHFFSVTRKSFSKGLGIAFNNTMKPVKNLILPENSKIRVVITRGPGVMSTDSNKNVIILKSGDVIHIRKHGMAAKLLKIRGKTKVRI
ncbi:hypothetical protein FJZ53_03630 [Candidatus Woesearchaeota archaeon]|nr:hypothetical protein [Candidatus Woesearchaeota archaeon]